MATGASTADLAVVLVDARKGLLTADPPPQLHRVAAGHPPGAAGGQQDGPGRLRPGRVRRHRRRVPRAGRAAGHRRTSTASRCRRCAATTWSRARATCPGTTARRCSSCLETVPTSARAAATPRFRLPVQWVCRPNQDFRGFAGTIAAGAVSAGRRGRGAAVRAALADRAHRHRRRRAAGSAGAGQAVTLTLARRDRRQPRRRDRRRRAIRRRSPTSSPPTCCGWAMRALLPGRPYWLQIGSAHRRRHGHRDQAQGRRQHPGPAGRQAPRR